MTGHPLVGAPNAPWVRCFNCSLRRDAHVRKGDKPLQMRCPPHALRSVPGFFFPAREADDIGEFTATGKLQMMHDGSLENRHSQLFSDANWYRRSGRYLCDLWWTGSEDEVANRLHRQQQPYPDAELRAWFGRPFFVGIPGAPRPYVFGHSILDVSLHGFWGMRRRVVISPEALGLGRLSAFVLALGQGAKGMQQEAWLELEVRLGPGESQAGSPMLLDMILLFLHVRKKLILTGRAARRVYAPSADAAPEDFLFKSLELIAPDCAAMELLLE
jgi:hypothetical protein